LAEDSPATFESLFRGHWPETESKDAVGRADAITAAVLRLVQSRSFFARFVAASFFLHLVVLAALVWMEPTPPLTPAPAQEISVDLVAAPPAAKPSGGPKGSPDGAKSGVSKTGVSKSGASKPAAAAAPKPVAAKPVESKPVESAPKPIKPDAQKPPDALPAPAIKAEVKPPPPKPEPPKPEPAKPAPIKSEPVKPEPVKPEPLKPVPAAKPPPVAQSIAPKPAPPPVPQTAPLQPPPQLAKPLPVDPPPAPVAPSGTSGGQPDGLMQDDSRAVAVPQPSADGDETVSYQTLVFSLLELNKQFPEDARRRGASGTALIAFELNDDGTVKTEKLLRSSGDAALDVESLALVQRAAPFPKPPPGAQTVFAADITFPAPK
jgi:TonB family protein